MTVNGWQNMIEFPVRQKVEKEREQKYVSNALSNWINIKEHGSPNGMRFGESKQNENCENVLENRRINNN